MINTTNLSVEPGQAQRRGTWSVVTLFRAEGSACVTGQIDGLGEHALKELYVPDGDVS